MRGLVALTLLAVPLAADASPSGAARTAAFTVTEATWTSVDVSPDSARLVFDILGDIYELPARGGRARPLLTGPAFESQPVHSPDGRWIAYISDRDGSENLWVARADGSMPRRVSSLDGLTELMSPAWAPDGRRVYVSKVLPAVGAASIWAYDLDGTGEPVVEHDAPPGTPRDRRPSAVGAAPSPDGHHLYYAVRPGHYRRDGAAWSIVRRGIATGTVETVIAPPGGAARPVLSRDGRRLAYVTRRDGHSALRVRDLVTGADREVAWPVQLDQRDTWATMDVAPRHAFTPDGRALFFTRDARLHRADLDGGHAAEVPLRAAVELTLGPSLRREIAVEDGPVRARLIQHPVESPDATRVAFSALAGVFVMDLADEALPRRVTPEAVRGHQPSWSPDGKTLAFVTWDASAGGHVMTVDAHGGAPRRVTRDPAFYTHPVHAPDGRSVYAIRSSHHDRVMAPMEYGAFRQADLVRIRLRDGATETLASGRFGGPPQPAAGRVYVHASDGLTSFLPDGSDRRIHVRVVGAPYYFEEQRSPVFRLHVSPDGRRAIAQHRSQAWLVDVPRPDGEPPTIDVADVRALARHGADFAGWSADGSHVTWAVGATWYRRPLDGGDARAYPAVVEVPRDVPDGTLVLRGATVITMRGDEVIADADVVVRGNRIAAVGRRGEVVVPEGADVRDASGRYVMPGFIDTHAHWADVRRGVLEAQPYSFLANLAFGVTAGLDVSTLTIDSLAYEDMLEAGMIVGLRAFSTGPAVFSFHDFDSRDAVRDVLVRYRDHYRVTNVKQYRSGNRRVRRWFADVSAELGLMPTTEGADNFKLSITQVLDGYAGLEHALPVAGVGADVVEVVSRSGIAYTPTLSIADSSATLGHFILDSRAQDDPRVRRFIPPHVIEQKTTRLEVLRDDAYLYRRQARDVARMFRAGTLVGTGSHSEFHGIGLHWEMQALAAGGLTPSEVLRIATIGSAEAIGRAASLGSVEPGKLADLVILDKDPRDDIRHTLATVEVMKNGRLYDAATLDELWPRRRALPDLWFW